MFCSENPGFVTSGYLKSWGRNRVLVSSSANFLADFALVNFFHREKQNFAHKAFMALPIIRTLSPNILATVFYHFFRT